MDLWKIQFGVRPAPSHPLYYDWQFGRLFIYILAESGRDAANRAYSVVKQLPYELPEERFPRESSDEDTSTRCGVMIMDDNFQPSPEVKSGHDNAADMVSKLGIGFFLEVFPVGVEEPSNFFQNPDL